MCWAQTIALLSFGWGFSMAGQLPQAKRGRHATQSGGLEDDASGGSKLVLVGRVATGQAWSASEGERGSRNDIDSVAAVWLSRPGLPARYTRQREAKDTSPARHAIALHSNLAAELVHNALHGREPVRVLRHAPDQAA